MYYTRKENPIVYKGLIEIQDLHKIHRISSSFGDYKLITRAKTDNRLISILASFVDPLCYLCLVFVMPSHLFIAALLSPAGQRADLLALVCVVHCVFVTFPCGILGQVWCLIVSIPDLYHLSYFD